MKLGLAEEMKKVIQPDMPEKIPNEVVLMQVNIMNYLENFTKIIWFS